MDEYETSRTQDRLAWTARRVAARPLRYSPLFGLAALLAIAMLLSMGPGPVHLSPAQTVAVLLERLHINFISLPVEHSAQQASVLWTLRLPRALTAVVVGACLSAAGAMMQGLFRSPVADPGLVGTSSGAVAAAVTFMALMHLTLDTWEGRVGVLVTTLAGASLGLWGAYRIGEVRGKSAVSTMLLTGIAVQAVSTGLIALLSYVARDTRLHDLGRWTLGGLGHTTWQTLAATGPFVVAFGCLAMWLAPALDAVILGDAEAAHLGYRVGRVRRIAGLAIALAMAAAVTAGGAIAFLGLVVPHVARQLVGSRHRPLMLGSAMLGAAILLAADLIARSLAPPAEVPVGILTILVGAPFFVWLLAHERSRGGV